MGTLYIVPTPIGNLEDITLRALRVLREVALIAAEDTRTTRLVLRHYDINTPLLSYHEHNKLTRLDAIFEALAQNDVALVSDAGTPGISDPGYELIAEAIARDVTVTPLPGATAIIPALVASGLPADEFVYLGFLPRKANARRALLESLADERRTLVAYESPHRLLDTLTDLHAVLGERPLCVARELTKMFETFRRGSAGEVLEYYRANAPRGEVVLVIGGAPGEDTAWDEARVRSALAAYVATGHSLSSAAKTVAVESGWKKSAVYRLGVEGGG